MSESQSDKIMVSESYPTLGAISTARDRLSGIIFAGLCLIVAVAPLPLGSARPLAWDVLALTVALLLLATLLLPPFETTIAREGLSIPTVLFVIVIGIAILQIVPWIPSGLRNPIWDQARDLLGKKVHGSIAVDRPATLIYVLRLLSYAGIFYLSVVTGRDASRARVSIRLVALSGCFYAVYGLFVYWSGNRTVLWFPKWAYPQDLSGPFVNKNTFATYLGLCTLAALTLTLETFARMDLRGDMRRKVTLAIEFISRRSLNLIMIFILLTALLLTHSRAGLLATIFGVMAFLLAITFAPGTGRLRRVGAWSIGPCVLIILVALLISGGMTLNRFFTTDSDLNFRLLVDQLTVEAIKDYPIVGIGLGSFSSVFQIYRTSDIGSYVTHPNNDYLQNLLELGIPAAFCLFVSMGCLIGLCIHGIRSRLRDAIFPCLGLAASALVGLHSALDSPLQIPAVTVVYVFLLGIAIAQSVSSRKAALKH